MDVKEQILEIIEKAIQELSDEGLSPDILLAGPDFAKNADEILEVTGLKVYIINELDYDAVVADSRYLGQLRRASRRISIEPILVEEKVWEEIKDL